MADTKTRGQAAKKATSKRGRKAMTDEQKAEERRVSGFAYDSIVVEESEDLVHVKAEASNEMIPHLRRSLDEGDGEGEDRIGKTFAMVLPDQAIAKRAKSKLVSAAEHLKIGVRTSGPNAVTKQQEDGSNKVTGYKLAFRAVAKRKTYTPRKTAESKSAS